MLVGSPSQALTVGRTMSEQCTACLDASKRLSAEKRYGDSRAVPVRPKREMDDTFRLHTSQGGAAGGSTQGGELIWVDAARRSRHRCAPGTPTAKEPIAAGGGARPNAAT